MLQQHICQTPEGFSRPSAMEGRSKTVLALLALLSCSVHGLISSPASLNEVSAHSQKAQETQLAVALSNAVYLRYSISRHPTCAAFLRSAIFECSGPTPCSAPSCGVAAPPVACGVPCAGCSSPCGAVPVRLLSPALSCLVGQITNKRKAGCCEALHLAVVQQWSPLERRATGIDTCLNGFVEMCSETYSM